jgi:hypothetical protein
MDLQSLLWLFPGIMGFEMAEATSLDGGAIGNNMINLHFHF